MISRADGGDRGNEKYSEVARTIPPGGYKNLGLG